AMLNIRGLTAGYGHCQALFGVDLEVREGQVLGLIGRNGMGRSTVIKCLFGLLPVQAGSIQYRDQALRGMAPYRIGRLGLSLVPEGRQIFPTLTVEENLVATAVARGGARAWSLERVYALFPRLRDRRANLGTQPSGGEQQMLALGRALMTNPSLLMLDEATVGRSPVVPSEIWRGLAQLKAEGLSMIVMDNNTSALLPLSERIDILDKGVSVWDGSSAEPVARPDLVDTY